MLNGWPKGLGQRRSTPTYTMIQASGIAASRRIIILQFTNTIYKLPSLLFHLMVSEDSAPLRVLNAQTSTLTRIHLPKHKRKIDVTIFEYSSLQVSQIYRRLIRIAG